MTTDAAGMCVLRVAVNQRQSVKLTFGDADSQQSSPASKRLKLVTDSIDCLSDLREQPTKSSTVSSSLDRTPHKFRLLFGGSSEDLSQQLSPGVGDLRADVVDAESEETNDSQSDPSSSSDTSESESEIRQNEDVMTQADEEVMKTYVPLSAAAALSYISDDDDDNVLDFFLKPPSRRRDTVNCQTAKPICSHPSTTDDATDGYGAGNKRAKTSTVMSKTSNAADDRCDNPDKELDVLKLFVQEPSAVISKWRNKHSTSASAHAAYESNKYSVSNIKKDDYFVSEITASAADITSVKPTRLVSSQDSDVAVCQLMCTARSCSQASDDFLTAASQNSTDPSVVVVNGDPTSRSAGSQPLDSDSTIDIGCSPVKNRLKAAGTPPAHVGSDATTTDGWCTPHKSAASDVISPRSAYCTGRMDADWLAVSAQSPCSRPSNISSTSQRCVSDSECRFLRSSVSYVAHPFLKSASVDCSAGLCRPTSSPVLVQLCRDVTSSVSNDTATNHQPIADSYDGDVDSDSDDVISLCVGVHPRQRRLRSRSTSSNTVVISSDSEDQSQPLWTSRDHSVGGVRDVSSGSESDDSLQPGCSEADFTSSIPAVDRSPVLFSESST